MCIMSVAGIIHMVIYIFVVTYLCVGFSGLLLNPINKYILPGLVHIYLGVLRQKESVHCLLSLPQNFSVQVYI